MEPQRGGEENKDFGFQQAPGKQHAPPVNVTPQAVRDTFMFALAFLEKYGWFIVLGAIVIVYLWHKFKPHWVKMQQRWERQQEAKNFDAENAAREQEKMEIARRRLQEVHDANAARYQEEKQQLEAQKRQERIEDWERHQEGKGYRSKKNKPTDETTLAQNVQKPKKKPMRNSDYSPLSGGGGGSCYRPSRRGGAGGGG